MYLRETKRRNADGSVVRYFQLAENTWDAARGCAIAKVVYLAFVSTYQDTSCMVPLLSTTIGTGAPERFPAMPLSMGGMEVYWMTKKAGTCAASGGLAVGKATPTEPTTFCCQPPP
ncbi:MAG: hypothetical protein IT372_37955 [Polyangiaceae bacterium]|nr:hypothetical protein [Polyangiaceae bacterium]